MKKRKHVKNKIEKVKKVLSKNKPYFLTLQIALVLVLMILNTIMIPRSIWRVIFWQKSQRKRRAEIIADKIQEKIDEENRERHNYD